MVSLNKRLAALKRRLSAVGMNNGAANGCEVRWSVDTKRDGKFLA
jgi:hypothetical protein